MLPTALGPVIATHLGDPDIVEIMLNPDGRLWIDRLPVGIVDTGSRIAPADAERIVQLVAHHVGAEVHSSMPRVSAELPESGERFEGIRAARGGSTVFRHPPSGDRGVLAR